MAGSPATADPHAGASAFGGDGACGNGMRQELEACDEMDLARQSCVSLGYDGGELSCSASCEFDTSSCTGDGPVCGDGTVEGLEQCDLDDANGNTCISIGHQGGQLACTAGCEFDTSGCSGAAPICGDGKAVGLEECDGPDSGLLSCADFGFTAGSLGCDSGCKYETSGCTNTNSLYDLDGASGCEGVYNPDQILDYHLTGDWTALLNEPNDGTSTLVVPFELSCNDQPPIQVAIERKRGGGNERIGLNLDINEYAGGQRYYGLKKLVFDNSVGCCEGDDASHENMIREYLAWRMMALSNVVASRVVFANLHVNGEPIGVLLNVEAVDKTFVGDRFGDDDGWLYKKSGGPGDGLKTNESCAETTCPNPYADWFCFWRVEGPGCSSPPADVGSTLPDHLLLEQMLRFGAVNAIVVNTDGPIFKNNNYYVYDWPGKRAYIPWDLDTSMKTTSYDVFAGGESDFASVLLPTWEEDYAALVAELVQGPLSVAGIHAEADRLLSVAGDAIDADPYRPETAEDMIGAVKQWWVTRHENVTAQLTAR